MGLQCLRTVSFFVIVVSSAFFALSEARRFYIGGNGGWVTNPSENYNAWAERNRFQVLDTLYFRYKKDSDSVLEVSKADYDSCNTKNPLKKMEDGNSEFVFSRYGPFYFISGNEDHCKKGQKLLVTVLTVTPKPPTTAPPPHAVAPAKPPSPKSPSPAPRSSSVSPSPTRGKSPSSPPPKSTPHVTPSTAPAKSPSVPPSSLSPSPSAKPPKSTSPPKSSTPKVSPSRSPNSPEHPPKSSPPPNPQAPAPEKTEGSADITAPAPSPKSSGSVLTVMSVTTALTVALTVFMSV